MAELTQYNERNPWGTPNALYGDPRFKYEGNQWWDLRGSQPVVDRALTEQYAGGYYDPGTTGSPWWWYSGMNPGMADMYRNQYGSSSTQTQAGAVHPGTYAMGQTQQGMLRNWVNPQNTGAGIANFLPGFDAAKYGNQQAYSSFIQNAGYDPVTGYRSGMGPQQNQPQIGSAPNAPGTQPQLNNAPNAPGTQSFQQAGGSTGNIGTQSPGGAAQLWNQNRAGQQQNLARYNTGQPGNTNTGNWQNPYGNQGYWGSNTGSGNWQSAYSNPGYWGQTGNLFQNPMFLQALMQLLSQGGM